jgi:lysine-N-methylase
MNRQQLILIPEYMQQFTCIGGECEDTCCTGFKIPIDKATYDTYQLIDDPDLKKIIKQSVKPNSNQTSDKSFGYIEQVEQNRCAFLNESGWCKMQHSKGEDALSLICHTYPRVVNVVDGIMEQAATTSCPEIARLALLNKEGMKFIENKVAVHERHNVGIRLDTINKQSNGKQSKHVEALDFFWDIRLFAINTLQTRMYTVAERLLILALFFQKADDAIHNGQSSTLSQLTKQYDGFCESGAFKQALMKMPTHPQWKFNLIANLLRNRSNFPITNQRFNERYQLVSKRFDLLSDSPSVDTITELYSKWEPVLTTQFDYIFENYLVNYMFKNVFPFSGYRTLQEEFMMFAIHFAMIRMIVVGLAEESASTFNEQIIVDCIQSYSKEIEHNAIYIKYVYETLLLNECNGTAKLSMLLKGCE